MSKRLVIATALLTSTTVCASDNRDAPAASQRQSYLNRVLKPAGTSTVEPARPTASQRFTFVDEELREKLEWQTYLWMRETEARRREAEKAACREDR